MTSSPLTYRPKTASKCHLIGGVGVTMWIWRDTNIQVTIARLKFSLLDRNVECLWVKGNYDRNGCFSDILPKLGGKAPDVLETELKLMGLHSS